MSISLSELRKQTEETKPISLSDLRLQTEGVPHSFATTPEDVSAGANTGYFETTPQADSIGVFAPRRKFIPGSHPQLPDLMPAEDPIIKRTVEEIIAGKRPSPYSLRALKDAYHYALGATVPQQNTLPKELLRHAANIATSPARLTMGFPEFVYSVFDIGAKSFGESEKIIGRALAGSPQPVSESAKRVSEQGRNMIKGFVEPAISAVKYPFTKDPEDYAKATADPVMTVMPALMALGLATKSGGFLKSAGRQIRGIGELIKTPKGKPVSSSIIPDEPIPTDRVPVVNDILGYKEPRRVPTVESGILEKTLPPEGAKPGTIKTKRGAVESNLAGEPVPYRGGEPSLATKGNIVLDKKTGQWGEVVSSNPKKNRITIDWLNPENAGQRSVVDFQDFNNRFAKARSNETPKKASPKPRQPRIEAQAKKTVTEKGVKTKPIQPKADVVVETDISQRQQWKNSIDEGELILKSGRNNAGKKLSNDQLAVIQNAVDHAKMKLGIELPVKDLKKVGDSQSVMGNKTTVSQSRRIDGVDYELYKGDESNKGFVRVFDSDSGKTVSVESFPTFKKAERAYNEALQYLGEKVESKPPKPAPKGKAATGKIEQIVAEAETIAEGQKALKKRSARFQADKKDLVAEYLTAKGKSTKGVDLDLPFEQWSKISKEHYENALEWKRQQKPLAETPTEAVKEIIEGKRESTIGTKEFKSKMIAEIDKAIEGAKTDSELPERVIEIKNDFKKAIKDGDHVRIKNRTDELKGLIEQGKAPTVTIRIPGDGDFTLLNHKSALIDLKNKVSKMPDFTKPKTTKQFATTGRSGTKQALQKAIESGKKKEYELAYGEPTVTFTPTKKATKVEGLNIDKWKKENEAFDKAEGQRGGSERVPEFQKNINSPDKQIEATFNNKGVEPSFVRKVADKIASGFKNIQDDFTVMSRGLKKKFPDTYDTLREWRGRVARSRRSAEDTMSTLLGKLKDIRELEVFSRLVILKDWQETARVGLRIESNLTLSQIKAEIARLGSIANSRIKDTVNRHFEIMRALHDEWLERKGRDITEEGRKFYYPHKILDFIDDRYDGLTPDAPSRIKTPFNPNLQIQRRGSAKAIEKNYIKTMSDYFHKYYLDREMDLLIDDVMKKHHDPTKLDANGIPVEGWTEFVDYGRSGYYKGISIAEKAVELMVDELETGKTVGEALKARETLMVGSRPSWIVPKEVAEAAAKIREPGKVPGTIKALNKATGWWKFLIVNPILNSSFFMLQVLSDPFNLFLTRATAAKKIPAAISEITKETLLKKIGLSKGSEIYKRAEASNAINSGFFGVELPTIEGRANLWRLLTPKQKAIEIAKFPPRIIEGLNRERENSFRFARFMYELEKGTTTSKAARLARETGPDYGNFTQFENTWLRGLLAPFYSWAKENLRFMIRTLRERPLQTTAKIAAVYYATAAWNELRFPEEEKKITETSSYLADNFHVILGKTSDGKPIVFYPQNPMDDFMSWFGINQRQIREDIALATGLSIPGIRKPTDRKLYSITDYMENRGKELVLAWKYKGLNIMTPLIKEPIQQFTTDSGWDFFYDSPIVSKYLTSLPEGEKGRIEDKIPFTDIPITMRTKHVINSFVAPFRSLTKAEKAAKKGGFEVTRALGIPLRDVNTSLPIIDIPKTSKEESMRKYIDLEDEIAKKYGTLDKVPEKKRDELAQAFDDVTKHYRYPNGYLAMKRDKRTMLMRRVNARRLKELTPEQRRKEFER